MWITGVLTLWITAVLALRTERTTPQLQVWITGVLTLWVLEPMGLSHPILRGLVVFRVFRIVRICRELRMVTGFKELWMLVQGRPPASRSCGCSCKVGHRLQGAWMLVQGRSPASRSWCKVGHRLQGAVCKVGHRLQGTVDARAS